MIYTYHTASYANKTFQITHIFMYNVPMSYTIVVSDTSNKNDAGKPLQLNNV